MMPGASTLDLHAYAVALNGGPRGASPGTGAALRTAQGRLLLGCGIRVDGAPDGCAIRHALAAAQAEEGCDLVVDAVALVAVDTQGETVPAVPCEHCLRWLLAFGPEIRVIYRHPLDGWCERSARTLDSEREALA